jgi:hypothetical protein
MGGNQMSKQLLLLVVSAFMLMEFNIAAAQTSGAMADEDGKRKNECLDKADALTGTDREKKRQECWDDFERAQRARNPGGGNTCSTFRKEITEAKTELCKACSSLDRGTPPGCAARGSKPSKEADVERIVNQCEGFEAGLKKCRKNFDSMARMNKTSSTSMAGVDIAGIFSRLKNGDGGNCDFLLGQNKEDAKEAVSEYKESFRENDDNRKEAEAAYFKTEAEMLDDANEIQEKIIDAQKDAEETQVKLSRLLRDVEGKAAGEAARLAGELEKLNAAEQDLMENGSKFITEEFESSKELLELSCMDRARTAVADKQMKKATKKGSNQWKFGGFNSLVDGGVGYKEKLNQFGMQVYQNCKKGDKEFVKGFQDALLDYKKKVAKRELDLIEIRRMKVAIEEGLKKLPIEAQNEKKDAIEDAERAWRNAQNKVMSLQSEFQRKLQATAQLQSKNVADITLYRKLAEEDKKSLDAARAALELSKGHKDNSTELKQNEAETAAAMAKLTGIEKEALLTCCKGKEGVDSTWNSTCKTRNVEPSSADAPQ